MHFADRSTKIAEEFLQTVLVIDDRAFDEPASEVAIRGDLKTPGRSSPEKSPPEDLQTDAEEKARNDSEHSFDVKALVREFSARSLFCSVLDPGTGEIEDLYAKVAPAAANADILVIDWVLVPGGEGEGKETLELIQRVLKSDREDSRVERLRKIAIYTGTPDLREIAEVIQAYLQKLDSTHEVERLDDFTLRQGNVQVAVFAKGDAFIPGEDDALRARVKSISELPEALIEDFSKMTSGLVSNAVVHSLTVLRNNTFRLISKFDRRLDAPYLEHRSLLESPSDAEEYLVRLIISEIGSVLEDTEVRQEVSINRIEEWIEDHLSDLEAIDNIFQSGEPDVRSVRALLKLGVDDRSDLPGNLKRFGGGKRALRDDLILKAFTTDDYHESDKYGFEILTLFRSGYGTDAPRLTLGTVVRSGQADSPKYWLCLQPRCDSVRLEKARSFPLLPAVEVEAGKPRHLVVHDAGEYRRLKFKIKPYACRMVSFKPDGESRVVKARLEDECFLFDSESEGRYTWVADLKFEQAQRFAQLYAGEIARVGLDESERLRRLR
jgi:hypothetical protein